MKVGVFGSRSITDNRVVNQELTEFFKENPEYNMIVTTQAKGVCEIAQIFAKENAIPVELHYLNFTKYARGAHQLRSEEVIKSSDFILLIHDGISKGTQNELDTTIKFCKPYKYIVKSLENSNATTNFKITQFSFFNDVSASEKNIAPSTKAQAEEINFLLMERAAEQEDDDE